MEPQQQSLGQGLRRTRDSGTQEGLHAYVLHCCVPHSCHTAFILPGEAFYQSCFTLQEAMLCKHSCTREKILGKTSCLLCHIFEAIQNMRTGFWKCATRKQPKCWTFFGKSCGMSFIPGMSLSQWSCQLANTGQMNARYSPKRWHPTLSP